MPTNPESLAEIRRLAAARDEALRRYNQHLTAIQLRNSRWSVILSHGRGRLPVRSRIAAVTASPTLQTDAH
jgi:hypothetical protein